MNWCPEYICGGRMNYIIPERTRNSMKKGKTNRNEIFKAKVTTSRNKAKLVKKSRKANRK